MENEEHQESQQSYWKNYYENNKEKVCQRNKAYREKNTEKLKEEYKKYWLENGAKIKERRKQLIECPYCNVKVTRESFSRHKLSKSHISKQEPKNENVEEIKSNETI